MGLLNLLFRQALLAFLPSLFLLSSLLHSGEPSSSSGSWPQFRGNPQLTGESGSLMPESLKLLWTYQAEDSIESSPAIAEGAVFAGVQSGHLLSLDLESGKVRWKYRAGDGIGESSPCLGNGMVYVGDLSGTLHAIDARRGEARWTFQTEGEIKSSPVLVDNRVIIGSYDGYLYCLSADRGALIWKFETSGPVHCSAGVSDGLTYIAGCDEFFRAIRISDGREVFKVPSGSYTAASPALSGESAYYGTFNNEVIAVNLPARQVEWRYEPKHRQYPFYSSAALAEGRVVVGGRDKRVHCLDARTGEALWTFATLGRVESSPAIAANRVYVGSSDGRFYVLDLATGVKLWEFHAGAPILASPAIASGRVVIGSQDGQLYCFGG